MDEANVRPLLRRDVGRLRSNVRKFRSALRRPSDFVRWGVRAAGLLTVGPLVTYCVRHAYDQPARRFHKSIRMCARRWYGLEPSRFPLIWLMALEQVYAAQARLYHKGFHRSLGVVPIGAQGIVVKASAADAYTSSIYLFGFDANLTIFETYARYAVPGSVAVDVGANCGLHTAVLARCVGPDGQVHAFEPVPQLTTRLEQTLALNCISNVVTHKVGAAERAGKVGFAFDPLAFNTGLGHGAKAEGGAAIDVVRLDDELALPKRPVSLIKVDVEGMEVSVLKGAQHLLAEHRPAVVVEVNSDEWSLEELRASFPFPIEIRAVPLTKSGKADPVDSHTPSGTNLLVLPA